MKKLLFSLVFFFSMTSLFAQEETHYLGHKYKVEHRIDFIYQGSPNFSPEASLVVTDVKVVKFKDVEYVSFRFEMMSRNMSWVEISFNLHGGDSRTILGTGYDVTIKPDGVSGNFSGNTNLIKTSQQNLVVQMTLSTGLGEQSKKIKIPLVSSITN